jgi:hypothetical protein
MTYNGLFTPPRIVHPAHASRDEARRLADRAPLGAPSDVNAKTIRLLTAGGTRGTGGASKSEAARLF